MVSFLFQIVSLIWTTSTFLGISSKHLLILIRILLKNNKINASYRVSCGLKRQKRLVENNSIIQIYLNGLVQVNDINKTQLVKYAPLLWLNMYS